MRSLALSLERVSGVLAVVGLALMAAPVAGAVFLIVMSLVVWGVK
jgi:hypothetical protein